MFEFMARYGLSDNHHIRIRDEDTNAFINELLDNAIGPDSPRDTKQIVSNDSSSYDENADKAISSKDVVKTDVYINNDSTDEYDKYFDEDVSSDELFEHNIRSDCIIPIMQNNIPKINVVNCGNEDLSKLLTDEVAISCILKGNQSIIQLIKHFHFNDDYPEYQNIYMKDYNSYYICKFNGDSWILLLGPSVVNGLISKYKYLLRNAYIRLKDDFPLDVQSNFENFINNKDDKFKGLMIKAVVTLLVTETNRLVKLRKESQKKSISKH